jgi:glycine oxidase
VRNYDAIIIGAGVIGLSLALELHKQGLKILLVEKGEPGREASWAAGGMLADFPLELPHRMLKMASTSAAMYPKFVEDLELESDEKIDLRSQGTLLFAAEVLDTEVFKEYGWVASWQELEPNLKAANLRAEESVGVYLKERSVDPRDLTAAAIAAVRRRNINLSSGNQVLAVEVSNGRAVGVRTAKTSFSAPAIVNCAGAWAGQIGPHAIPTRPVKGQMLCVIMPEKEMIRHVVRTPQVYLIPRSDGRMLIGATAEEAGFDKQTVPEAIQTLRDAAVDLVPKLEKARFLDAWAGLRPATPDRLPIIGVTETPGYFVATGHFRDGILLAPITAKVMAEVITGKQPSIDISNFSASRFAA